MSPSGDPGDFIAAVPAMLGLVPERSLVVMIVADSACRGPVHPAAAPGRACVPVPSTFARHTDRTYFAGCCGDRFHCGCSSLTSGGTGRVVAQGGLSVLDPGFQLRP
ncbi:DUF4192 family protein [Nocardia sp. NBC_00881]|uniref:DUF4192 family protein n=1 Tax=Nocardia sp. NBC_00881 TaxID=2975995 RepID=UPI0038640046